MINLDFNPVVITGFFVEYEKLFIESSAEGKDGISDTESVVVGEAGGVQEITGQ